MNRYVTKLAFIYLAMSVLLSITAAYAADKSDDIWVPMEERVKIWDRVAGQGNYQISSNGLEATFEREGATWTIQGANAPIVNPTIVPQNWPVKGNSFELAVVAEPISNYKILPFTEPLENTVQTDTILLQAARDSYQQAGFVIRSGDVDLENITIELEDLVKSQKETDVDSTKIFFPKEHIDIRVVKCWYQAGTAINDTKHKLLTPELLLHDDGLIRVDYDAQVNMIRNFSTLHDADTLQKFHLPAHQNKQVWLTLHANKDADPGFYSGTLKVSAGNMPVVKTLKMNIEILPTVLPDSPIEYMLYNDAWLAETEQPPKPLPGQKTQKQMLAEFQDMKEHGLTNVLIWHRVDPDKANWPKNWDILRKTLEIRAAVGWGAKPLYYLDWRTTAKEDLVLYKEKIKSITEIANSFGIKEVYIYGVDEQSGAKLAGLRPLYNSVHEAGAKNFVACTTDFLLYVPDLLDLPVLNGRPPFYFMEVLKRIGIKAMNYHNPQAGIEEPATYRHNFGIDLYERGFAGACDYIYQQGWNDFVNKNWRSHTMAYATLEKPIPTIQWEGWRAAVMDVRSGLR